MDLKTYLESAREIWEISIKSIRNATPETQGKFTSFNLKNVIYVLTYR